MNTSAITLTTDVIFEDAETSLKCALKIRKHFTKIVSKNPTSSYVYNLEELDQLIQQLQKHIVSTAIAA